MSLRAAWRRCLRCFLTVLAGLTLAVLAAWVVVAAASVAPAMSTGAVNMLAATSAAAIVFNIFCPFEHRIGVAPIGCDGQWLSRTEPALNPRRDRCSGR